MCAACDATWHCVSIPWSAGKHVTRGSAARLGNLPRIELRDVEGWATQYQGVMDVLDVIGRIGMEKVGLATQKRQ